MCLATCHLRQSSQSGRRRVVPTATPRIAKQNAQDLGGKINPVKPGEKLRAEPTVQTKETESETTEAVRGHSWQDPVTPEENKVKSRNRTAGPW